MTVSNTLRDIVYLPPKGENQRCQICSGEAAWFGGCDFGVSGNDYFQGRRMFEDTGITIGYFRCGACGFLFTPAFRDFTAKDWHDHVYNDRYIDADPPFLEERPLRDAEMCSLLLAPYKDEMEILDYGGGQGRLTEELKKRGFPHASSFDPVYQPKGKPPRPADIITCFEVVEHVADQQKMMQDIGNLMKPGTVFLFSTQLQPDNIEDLGVGWWYIMPRNAHISIHSKQSLKILMTDHGFSGRSLCSDLHLAWRGRSPLSKQILNDTKARKAITAHRNPLPQSGT